MNSAKTQRGKRFATIAVAIALLINLHPAPFLAQETNGQTTHEINIADFAFVPQNVTINIGDTVTWNNIDPVTHTLWFVFVANESTYLLSSPIPPNSTWTHTFEDAAELQYYSFDRLWITGLINVTAEVEVHDIAVTQITTSKTVVGKGYSMNISITLENQGDLAENFNVTACYNESAIILPDGRNYTTITLTGKTTTSITLVWNTTNVSIGNYTMGAYAWPVPGEADLTDNSLQNGLVCVGVPCDITGPIPLVPDGVCNMRDIGYICSKFGTTPSSPSWDPNCDVTGQTSRRPDNIVNMRDIGEACSNFGAKYP
jgi:plastocyanin